MSNHSNSCPTCGGDYKPEIRVGMTHEVGGCMLCRGRPSRVVVGRSLGGAEIRVCARCVRQLSKAARGA